jgi:type II secretory ATPase GspE/PulE/Tfp pilus assembly ATPase PilB-like protein
VPERLFTAYQVANLLGVTPTEVAQWIQKGWLPVHRLPEGPVRIREKGLVRFLRDRGINLESILAGVATAEAPRGNGHEPQRPRGASPRKAPPTAPPHSPAAPSSDERAEMTEESPPNRQQDPRILPPADSDQSPAPPESVACPDGPSAPPAPEEPPPPALDSPKEQAQPAQAVPLERLLQEAIDCRAERILLATDGKTLQVRVRIDEVSHPLDLADASPDAAAAIIEAMTVLLAGRSEADIELSLAGRTSRLHVVSCPTRQGRRITIDLGAAAAPGLEQLGLSQAVERQLLELTERSSGLLLFAGPPRSGRRELMYVLSRRLAPGRDVAAVTWADSAVADSAVADSVCGGDGVSSLDALLRQRPDVVLLDRLPGPGWLKRATAAALDGCLVLAAAPARYLAEVPGRLAAAGLEEWDLADAVSGVVLQRQVRRLCPHCRMIDDRSKRTPGDLPRPEVAYAPAGCARCGQTGYAGRALIVSMVSGWPLREVLGGGQGGASLLVDAARTAVREGLTSLDEVARVLRL